MGIASLFKWGTLSDSFFQLNLVDRQISGATRLLLSLLADEVLFGIVGATCSKAASTVVRVVLQSNMKTGVGFRRSIMWPGRALCL